MTPILHTQQDVSLSLYLSRHSQTLFCFLSIHLHTFNFHFTFFSAIIIKFLYTLTPRTNSSTMTSSNDFHDYQK